MNRQRSVEGIAMCYGRACGVPLLTMLSFSYAAGAQTPIKQSSVPAEDTAAAVTERNWRAPRTSWGDPDLGGVWTTDDMQSVPRDRPPAFGTREKLTPEEFK